jgi:cytochrome c-type biogenesis protein CcmH
MSRPLLLAAGLSLILVGALVVAALLAAPGATTDEQRVERIAAGLRCPDCQALSVAESRTRAADAIRREIAEQVAAGHSDEAVRRHFVERYGEWILLAPDDALAWWLPVGVVLAAIAGFAIWLWSGGARRAAGSPASPSPPAPSASDRRRVDEELEALDG